LQTKQANLSDNIIHLSQVNFWV